MIRVEPALNAKAWYHQAKQLVLKRILPQEVEWDENEQHQFLLEIDNMPQRGLKTVEELTRHEPSQVRAITAPQGFADLAQLVLCSEDPARHDLLYRLLWRMNSGEPHLLEIKSDRDVIEAERLAKAVSRDLHKMKAFVRFRKAVREGVDHYIAWYKPDHRIVRLVAPFFVRRFGDRPWSILTPDECAHWDLEKLHFSPGVGEDELPEDRLEDLWCTYYAAIFNPARVKLKAMQKEMPQKRWGLLPEAKVIQQAVRDVQPRLQQMAKMQKPSARPFVPSSRRLSTLAEAAQKCQGCELYKKATQTVFGEGSPSARLLIVGEQPGDQEDIKGHPFVGPAGRLFQQALDELGIARESVYLTNAVKHFKFVERGKIRLHQKPLSSEIAACRPWLEAEMAMVKPKVILCLGATAAQSIMGRAVRIGEVRGKLIPHPPMGFVMVTTHPSAILRMPDAEKRKQEYAQFVREMKLAYDRAKDGD